MDKLVLTTLYLNRDELLKYFDKYEKFSPFIEYFNKGNVLIDRADVNLFVLVFKYDILVGVSKTEIGAKTNTIFNRCENVLSFISVHKEYRNNGIGKYLVKETINKLEELGLEYISLTPFTPDGFEYLKHHFEKIRDDVCTNIHILIDECDYKKYKVLQEG